ncbi:hypothetical protein SAMN05216320_1067 [Duganella sp. OV458]|nr:hypothetical protein SAMN05216320_1067 [Duganella sp. OV458]SDJ89239.1 hypothetical protein SAMN05428973_1077 [Duganella sp. OV510]
MRDGSSATCATLLAAALMLTACGSVPQERFYSLSNGLGVGKPVPADGAARTTLAAPAYYIELPAVTVPKQVARNQLVVTTGASRIDVLEQERWSAPPAAEIGQALSLTITGELGTIDVFRNPVPDKAPVYRISTNVQRFESAPGQYALIDAVWSVRLAGNAQVLTCRSVAQESVGAGYDELVAGHRRAVTRIGADIAKAVRTLAAGEKPSC